MVCQIGKRFLGKMIFKYILFGDILIFIFSHFEGGNGVACKIIHGNVLLKITIGIQKNQFDVK